MTINHGNIPVGTGPIFLTDLLCNGDESSLFHCSRWRNHPIGLLTCDHNGDVAVRCAGKCIEGFLMNASFNCFYYRC